MTNVAWDTIPKDIVDRMKYAKDERDEGIKICP